MTRLIRAIYENGIFRPLDPLTGLGENAAVRLRVEEMPGGEGTLSEFCGIWTKEEADDFEALIQAEFERVDPHDW